MTRYLAVLTFVIGYAYSLDGPNVCTKQETYVFFRSILAILVLKKKNYEFL